MVFIPRASSGAHLGRRSSGHYLLVTEPKGHRALQNWFQNAASGMNAARAKPPRCLVGTDPRIFLHIERTIGSRLHKVITGRDNSKIHEYCGELVEHSAADGHCTVRMGNKLRWGGIMDAYSAVGQQADTERSTQRCTIRISNKLVWGGRCDTGHCGLATSCDW